MNKKIYLIVLFFGIFKDHSLYGQDDANTHLKFLSRGHTTMVLDTDNNQCRFIPFQDSLTKLSTSFSKIENMLPPPSCDKKVADLKDPYSPKYCEEIYMCANKKIGEKEKYGTQEILNKFAEFDMQDRLQKLIRKMERIEKVKNFSVKIGIPGIADKCNSRFDTQYEKKTCENKLHELFTKISNNEENEFKKDYGYYAEDSKRDQTGKLSNFFKRRVEYNIESLLNSKDGQASIDANNLEELSKILADQSKSLEQRKLEFSIFLNHADHDTVTLDPILAFTNSNLFDEHKDFVDNLLQTKDLSKDIIKTQLIEYRKKRAEEILGNENKCNPNETLESLCNKTYQISKGKKVSKNIEEAKDAHAQEIKQSNNKDMLKEIQDLFFSQKNMKDDNFESARVVLEASRCIAYMHNKETKREDLDINYSFKSPHRGFPMEGNGIGALGWNGSTSGRDELENSPSSSVSEHELGKARQSNNAFNESATNANGPFNGASPGSAYNNNYFPSVSDTDENKQKEKPGKDSSVQSEVEKKLEKKINDLSTELKIAKENLDKLQKEKNTQRSEESLIKKINEDKERKIIEDLNKQIVEANAEKKKAIEASKKSIASQNTSGRRDEVRNNFYPTNFSSSIIERPTAKRSNYPTNSYPPSLPSTSEKSFSGSTVSSSRQVTLTATAPVNKAVSNIVKVINGNKDKFYEDIKNKILEGEPFLVEEDGVVSEIVPSKKDGIVEVDNEGNPIFKKVIKSQGLVEKQIQSTADLKRNEEEEEIKKQNERVEYFKLQELTNTVIQERSKKNEK